MKESLSPGIPKLPDAVGGEYHTQYRRPHRVYGLVEITQLKR